MVSGYQAPVVSKLSRPSGGSEGDSCHCWNDYNGDVTSDKQGLRMPVDFVPTTLVKQYFPRSSVWRHLVCHSGGQCRQGSGSVRLVLGVLCFLSGVSQLVLNSGGFRVDLSARGSLAHFTRETVRSSHFSWRLSGCHCGFQCRQSPVRYLPRVRSSGNLDFLGYGFTDLFPYSALFLVLQWYMLMRQSTELGVCSFFNVKVDLGSRGRCWRSCLTLKCGHYFQALLKFGMYASVHGGFWENSIIFFVKMNSGAPRPQLGSTVDTRSCVSLRRVSLDVERVGHFSASVHLDVDARSLTPGVPPLK